MDAEIAALASSAGSTIVTLMASDAWQRVRDGVAALWRRHQPERADGVLGELNASREDMLAADEDSAADIAGELATEWQGRLRRLMVARPEAANELRQLLAEIDPGGETRSGGRVSQRATASGSARIYQAGRDQHLTER